MAVRDTATTMLAAADRARGPAVQVRWLVRAFLELGFLGDRPGQAEVALRVAGVAREGLPAQEAFLATAVDGLVAAAVGDDRGTFRLMEAEALYEQLFEVGDPRADLLCTELYAEATLETGECIATRKVLEGVLSGGEGSTADRHRLYALLGRVELVLARPVPAASALHAARLLTTFVDEERLSDVVRRLDDLVAAPAGPGLTGEELEVAAALAHHDSVSAAAAKLSWSARDVEFYKASVRSKLDRPGRHRRLPSAG